MISSRGIVKTDKREGLGLNLMLRDLRIYEEPVQRKSGQQARRKTNVGSVQISDEGIAYANCWAKLNGYN